MLPKKSHFIIYYWGLILLAVSLPLFTKLIVVSAVQIGLAVNWLLEGNFRRKFQIIKERKSILIIISIYLIHILGLIYTKDYQLGLSDVRIKLPLLVLPVVIGTSTALDFKQIKILLLFFVSSVIVSTLISSAILFGFTKISISDAREISIFISHIRFALLICVAIFSLAYFLFSAEMEKTPFEKISYAISLCWLLIFLYLLQSFTGIAIFIITSFVFLWHWIRKLDNLVLRFFLITFFIIIPLLFLLYLTKSISKFYSVEDIDIKSIEKYTKKENPYWHDFENKQIENGNYIWLYISEEELCEEWNKLSDYDYYGKDDRDQEIKYTLIRYLTSKGYRKDAVGIAKLKQEDIKLIESGIANYIFKNNIGLYPRIYQLIWQIDVYLKGGNPSGHSITQRIIYLKTAFQIIKENFWLGTGTGDLQFEFDRHYEKTNSILSEKWRLRAHNQFVTFFIAFGFFGFLWIMFSLVYPVFYEKKNKDFLFLMFFVIALLSMLNEDTLETHAGVTFFSFFYALLLLGRDKRWF